MKIIYCYIVGDLLHQGHLLHLENCKALGDVLIAGVLTDHAVEQKKKAPIMSFPERIRMIQALKCVDIAVAQDEYSPITNIKAIRPDILVESTSHDPKAIDEVRSVMSAIGGKVIALPYYPGQSSTELKEKIKK
ncbi:MAG: adenylyltransferase/cytidyltransferase family protein, partial [Candidatus Omnitrophota bacterium]